MTFSAGELIRLLGYVPTLQYCKNQNHIYATFVINYFFHVYNYKAYIWHYRDDYDDDCPLHGRFSVCMICNYRAQSKTKQIPLPFPSLPFPFPSLFLPLPIPFHLLSYPFPFPLRIFLFLPPLKSRTPKIQLYRRYGERCKLPQRGPGRSPSRNRIWRILALKYDILWRQVQLFSWVCGPTGGCIGRCCVYHCPPLNPLNPARGSGGALWAPPCVRAESDRKAIFGAFWA